MKLCFIVVGKSRNFPYASAVDEYAKRIGRWADVQTKELKPSASSGPRAIEDEGDSILAALPSGFALVALDERGDSFTSMALSQWLEKQRDNARNVAFAIGGDDGLSKRVLAGATLTLSLSKMTLPHQLARLVLFEQVYRAFSILNREPYHRS